MAEKTRTDDGKMFGAEKKDEKREGVEAGGTPAPQGGGGGEEKQKEKKVEEKAGGTPAPLGGDVLGGAVLGGNVLGGVTSCPSCLGPPCPVSGGTRTRGPWRVRYRQCPKCERRFETRVRVITYGPRAGEMSEEERGGIVGGRDRGIEGSRDRGIKGSRDQGIGKDGGAGWRGRILF